MKTQIHAALRAIAGPRIVVIWIITIGHFSSPSAAVAWEWVPSGEDIAKYRQSWNPFSHGPMLVSAVDIQPQGQLHIRPFIFAQIGTRSFGNQLEFATQSKPGPVHLYSCLCPFLQSAYGLTDHIEIGGATSIQWFEATENNKVSTDTGLGDTSLVIKYRPIVQDPESWLPSFTLFSQLVLPTSKWAGTEKPPGGFSPIGRFPSTRSGEIGFTEGLTFRKNIQPFRFSAGVYYTYSAPGSQGDETTYSGDVINTRFVFEHILDDKRGLGYNIELVTLHGLTWRLDGKDINSGQKNGFTTIGIEPAIQWRFGDSNVVGAAGVLFTLAGQNSIEAIYPNFSLFWYWSKTGKVIMR